MPTQMRYLTGGRDRAPAGGRTLSQVLYALDADRPGMQARIVANGTIRPELAVAIDGVIAAGGLLHPAGDEA